MAAKKAPVIKSAKVKAITETQHFMLSLVDGANYLSPDEKSRIAKDVMASKYSKTGLTFPVLDQFNIKSHKLPLFVPAEGSAYPEIFDEKKNEWLPFDAEAMQVCDVLDSLTYATRKGLLNSRTWVTEIFRTKENWQFFLTALAGYELHHRIRDPWWYTLAKLAEHEDLEEGFSTAEGMAARLLEHSKHSGQFNLLT